MVTLTELLLESSLSHLTTKAYQKSVTMFHQFCQSELHIGFPLNRQQLFLLLHFVFRKVMLHHPLLVLYPLFHMCSTNYPNYKIDAFYLGGAFDGAIWVF